MLDIIWPLPCEASVPSLRTMMVGVCPPKDIFLSEPALRPRMSSVLLRMIGNAERLDYFICSEHRFKLLGLLSTWSDL